MAFKKSAPKPATRNQPQTRQAITFEALAAITPSLAKSERMVAIYGFEPVDYPALREMSEETFRTLGQTLGTNLNDRALAIFMQRMVGAAVSGAYGAAQFYSNKRSDALALGSKLLNDARDEDRDGVAGFESKTERAYAFAAEMGLQANALMAIAEGAVCAYEHVTGDTWKPYEREMPATPTVQRQSEAAMRAALEE